MTSRTDAARQPKSDQSRKRIRARGRSFLSLVLAPETPVKDWLEDLDGQIAQSAEFFTGRAVILDLSNVRADTPGITELPQSLRKRGLFVVAVENVDPGAPFLARLDFPPLPKGGKTTGDVDIPERGRAAPAPVAPAPPQNGTMILDRPLRSGQEIYNPDGDVIVLGAVSWGAEIMAAGNIHVYGPLRGRAIAGVTGQKDAGIFTTNFDAQLVAIDGFYRTQEAEDRNLIGKPVRVSLADDKLHLHLLASTSETPL